MKTSKLLSLLILGLLISFVSTSYVYAEDSVESDDPDTVGQRMENRREIKEEKREERITTMEQKREEIKEQRTEKKCENIGNMLGNRISMFEHNKDVHIENYTKLKNRLTEISTKLAAKGLDVTELNKDLATFDTMLTTYGTKYASFITELEAAKSSVCGDSPTPYKDQLETSKSLLKELKQLRNDIRKFYVDELRVDIKALREQATTLSTTEEAE